MFSRNRDTDMGSGPLFGKILLFALPIMALNLLQLLFNAADMIVVGQFAGKQPLAAVGATGALINLLVNIFMGLSVGTSVVVAQNFGAQDYKGIHDSVHTSIAISIIGGFFVMVIGLLFCEPLLEYMGTPDDIIHLSTLYMKIYFLGMPANMVYNFGAAILRASGDSKRPMYYLSISGVINVILNLFFVLVLHMTVDGVAWATVISQYISVALILLSLMKNHSHIQFIPTQLRIDRNKLIDIIRIGVPAGIQNILFSVSNILIQSAVNSFGSTMVAASTASSNIEGFIGTTSNAYYNAAITFAGQNMGAKKYKRIDSIAKICTLLVFATWIVVGGATLLFGRSLLSIYVNEADVIDLGMKRLQVMMITYFTGGLMNVYPGLIRGMGYSFLPMVVTLVGVCLMRIVWLATVFAWYPTVVVLFLCYPVTWGLTSIGHIITFLFLRKKVYKKDAENSTVITA
ncbi:MAG: MATE family efflux transporter [Clostridiaceae bacterium]|jgi:putative MATE family efflux protein|nr:MATE family efflux transporter [Clostridiaceae bacterium]